MIWEWLKQKLLFTVCSVPGTVPTDFLKVSMYTLGFSIFSSNLLLPSSYFYQMAPPIHLAAYARNLGLILDTSLFLMTPSYKILDFWDLPVISPEHILHLSNFLHQRYLQPWSKPTLPLVWTMVTPWTPLLPFCSCQPILQPEARVILYRHKPDVKLTSVPILPLLKPPVFPVYFGWSSHF